MALSEGALMSLRIIKDDPGLKLEQLGERKQHITRNWDEWEEETLEVKTKVYFWKYESLWDVKAETSNMLLDRWICSAKERFRAFSIT